MAVQDPNILRAQARLIKDPMRRAKLYQDAYTLRQKQQQSINDIMKAPSYGTIRDSGGLLQDNLRVSPNTEAIDALRAEATRQGPSPWAQMMMDQQAQRTSQAQGDIASQGQSNLGQMLSQAATTRGVGAGLADQLASQADRGAMFARQQLNRRNLMEQKQIEALDAQNQENIIQALPQLEASANQGDIFNITQGLSEKRAEDLAKFNQYQTMMQMYGAQKTGQAYANSGKK